ncbi:hypothetical protein ACX8XN_03790 [Calditrichota bacterium GD2]
MLFEKKYLSWLFIFFGLVFALDNLNVLRLHWALYIILAGLLFLLVYFIKKELTFFLLPGVMLTVYGFLFMYCALSQWQNMSLLWPVLFMAPGLGFMLLYFLQKRETYFLVPGGLLLLFGLLFFLRRLAVIKYWPLLLMGIGIVLLIRHHVTKT